MGIIIDLVIIGIVILSTFLAYQKGLVILIINLCAFAISIVIAGIVYQPITNLIVNETSIDETIENVIYEKVNEQIKEDGQYANQIIETAKNEMLPQTARRLAINIVTGGVMIVLFASIRIALIFIRGVANKITLLPIIHQFNKIGGSLYGILRGVIIVYVVLLILQLPIKIKPDNTIGKGIEQSFIGKVMYENNIFQVFFNQS